MGVSPDRTYTCNRRLVLGRARLALRQGPRHARHARAPSPQSCDIFFYQMALSRSAPTRSPTAARKFGLGQTFDIGIPGQKPGLIPDTAYKRRVFPERSGLAPRRDAQHGHRPGLCERQRAAAVRDVLAHRQRREGAPAAPGPFDRRCRCSRAGAPAPRPAVRPASTWTSCARPWPRWPTSGTAAGACAKLGLGPIKHGRQDRHRPVAQLRRRPRRARRAGRLGRARPRLVHRLRAL